MILHGSDNLPVDPDSSGSDALMVFEDLKPNDRIICQNCKDWVRDIAFHPLWTDKQSHWGICKSAKPRHNCRYFYHTCKRFERMKPMIKPIVTKDTNAKFVAEGFGDLPGTVAHDENGVPYIITAWEIPPEDLKKLNETGIIYLSCVGQTIPPVLLEADNPMEVKEGADNG